jgi:tRNA threonylcarbamoyladenosine biosynthesis protein TsaB
VKILAIDTATEGCSAALLSGDEVRVRCVEAERGHAERILPMVDELLAEASVSLQALDAIAFGRGPGSFTGVRLAASVTQGLAFGAGVPVVPVSDLRAVAQRLLAEATVVADSVPQSTQAPVRVLVCNDARMSEVYWGCFQREGDGRAGSLMVAVGAEHVGKPESVQVPDDWVVFAGAGRGFAAYPILTTRFGARLSRAAADLLPSAAQIVVLGAAEVRAGNVVAAEEALPVYLRDNVARPAAS